jgi:Polyketide cyclase / dehydrase and lipid transport
MINVTSTIDVYRPAGMVFDFISTPANDFEWQYGTLAAGSTSPGANGAGATFQSIGHLMGRRVLSTFEVTQYEINRLYGFKSLSGPLQLNTEFTLEARSGRTRLTIKTQAVQDEHMHGSEHAMGQYMQKRMREDLAMLKQLLEARALGAVRPAWEPAQERGIGHGTSNS